jgi:hypothetical protein
METSSIKQEQNQTKVSHKCSEVLPSNWHLVDKLYAGRVVIGPDNYWTEWFDSKEEAALELRCLEKRLSFELVETTEGEGYHPERNEILEQLYQESGRTNCLYTGLITSSTN